MNAEAHLTIELKCDLSAFRVMNKEVKDEEDRDSYGKRQRHAHSSEGY